MPEGQRADARRNYARILAVAEAEVAAHGPDASLEQIARRTGVGSATVRRHFPTRQALLEAVSHKRIDDLRIRAQQLTDTTDSRKALLDWLSEVVTYCVSARGLAVALAYDTAGVDPTHDNACAATLELAGAPLLDHAVRDGAVPPGVTVADLITLAVGMALATEHRADPVAAAQRLLRLTVAGLSPQDRARRADRPGMRATDTAPG
ncbi:TetR/AcrR family transcriptional regulator [Nocardia sp. alder85J]|uniref:TetR/AcrR family transcriptional regulator n=1 Tax=Nocardia sp. alder85J TaxID=2862949 RepID=UPI001CD543C5|nr:TetR/AcrR family transcriptional regulator [Nocardia sp. alder85J]MCX4098553.1 helix-turn-helix domain containing protein [Nocardia sp. alder85J]